MSRKRSTARLRTAAAYEVLRGRPPKPDYGLLLAMPFIAAAGGFLIALGIDEAVTRRASGRRVRTMPDLDSDVEATPLATPAAALNEKG